MSVGQREQARKPRSYASSKLRPTESLTGVKCRATSVAKKNVCRKNEMCDVGQKMRDIWLVLVLTSLLILDIGVKSVLGQGHLFAKIPFYCLK